MNARYVLSISAAKEFVLGQKIDLILSDFNLPGGNCMELFNWMRANGYRIPFLIMTGFGNIEKAVDAIKRGVDNYLIKPIQSEKVLNIIDDLFIESEKTSKSPFVYYYGKSPLALKTQEYIRIAAPVESLTILLRGESGTGKEYAARQIYAMSKRSNAPFIAVDCGTLPKELAASELFGYVKGAFTGELKTKPDYWLLPITEHYSWMRLAIWDWMYKGSCFDFCRRKNTDLWEVKKKLKQISVCWPPPMRI